MSEDAQLQARIAALSGQINKRKQSNKPHFQSASQTTYPYSLQPFRRFNRWSPYDRGGRGGQHAPHRNRTLVLNSTQKTQSTAPNMTTSDTSMADAPPPPSPPHPPPLSAAGKTSFVSTRRAGMNQLMTKDTFEREQKQKQEYQEQQVIQHVKPQARLSPKSHSDVAKTSAHASRTLEINGIRFQMLNDGSKLIRIPGELASGSGAAAGLSDADAVNESKTPKKVMIADVAFFRSKTGNLVRASSVKANGRPIKRAPKPQCEHFTKNGTCPFGPSCRFSHDPTKVAICKEFLRNGSCPAGKNCDLSHEPTYHRVSACTHFLRGNCTNSACRYPHLHVSPTAPVCRAFATVSFCSKGPQCDKRHIVECPDYSNHGRCANQEKGTCSLPHIDRASALRKAAERQAKTGLEDESDVTSNDDEQSPDEDSDEIESDIDVFDGCGGDSLELSQQKDFISFV